MKLLLDTNILLWLLLGNKRLNERLKLSIANAESLNVSIVSFWEISIKHGGKGFDDLNIPDDWHNVFEKAVERFQIKILGVNIESCRLSQTLPLHHKDPFDRMIISQALENDLAVITSDKVFKNYDVEVIS